jgi:VWFA-related protein
MRAGPPGKARIGAGLLAATMAAAQGLKSPVLIGFVIDNGASMRDNGNMVRAAVPGLLDMVQPPDEAFVMNFGSEAYVDADFTNDSAKLAEAAKRIDFKGFSAVWDAVGKSIQRLGQSGKQSGPSGNRKRKILVVVTAGEDAGSHESFDQLLQQARRSAVSVYSIGLIEGETKRGAQAARRALTGLAEASGGRVFFPKNLDQVEDATAQIAREIRGDSAK